MPSIETQPHEQEWYGKLCKCWNYLLITYI